MDTKGKITFTSFTFRYNLSNKANSYYLEEAMGVLSGRQIKELVQSGELYIEPFDETFFFWHGRRV